VVFAQGEGGDAIWSFAFQTVEGGDPAPSHAVIYWYQDVDESHLGVTLEIEVANIVEAPSAAAIHATVTDASGTNAEFEFDMTDDPSCSTGGIHGSAGPEVTGITGDAPPYLIEAQVTLDDAQWHVEPVTWPDDFPDEDNTSEWLSAGPAGE
jgi:hypothetical protein